MPSRIGHTIGRLPGSDGPTPLGMKASGAWGTSKQASYQAIGKLVKETINGIGPFTLEGDLALVKGQAGQDQSRRRGFTAIGSELDVIA